MTMTSQQLLKAVNKPASGSYQVEKDPACVFK